MQRLDVPLGRRTTLGAALIALQATKPAESDAKRTLNPTQAGQQSDEAGQLVMTSRWRHSSTIESPDRCLSTERSSDAGGEMSMRKVREVLRLKHALGMSYRAISEATGIGETAAAEYVHRAAVIGVTWPVPEAMSDAELELGLFPVGGVSAP